jgi:peptide/nickel transport system substrate-binding protein
MDERTAQSVAGARSMTRRLFLRRAALFSGGTLLLAACSSQAPAPAPTQAPAAKPTEVPSSTAPAAQKAPAETAKPAEAAKPAADAKPAAGQPRSGGTYTHGSAQEPDRFWGPITGLTVSNEVALLANATLVKTDDKLEYVPSLATQAPSLENGGITPDGLSYTFKLRPGVKWSDGTPFTSADVKFTYEVLTMPGVDVRGRVGWDQITQVDTPDETTITFKFKAVDAAFLDRVSAAQILPKHVLGGLDGPAINQHQWFRAPNPGLGPFTFKEWVPGSHITLTKNPNYYKSGQPYLDTVVFKIVPDANTLLNQLETGEVDSRWRLNNEHVDIVKGFRGVGLVSVPSATPWLLWQNHTRAPFGDKNVRLALAHGFDKEGIAKQLLKGLVEPAWQLISPLSWAHNPNVPKRTYDPTKAKQILDAAGWAPGPDGIRAKGADTLSFELMNITGEQERVQVLSFVQRQWKEIGVDARIRNVDVGTMWGQGLPKRNYDMAYSYTGRLADPEMSSHYLSPQYNPTTNFAGYANPEVDQLLLSASQTVDRAKRKELYFKVQELVADDQVYLFLAWLTNHTVMNTRIEGYKPAPAYVEFWNVDEWWVNR